MASKTAGKTRSSASARSRGKRLDAIALLKADHRQVETWFAQFSKSKSGQKKQQLAAQICDALTVHTTIEEEIFYPAFIEATGDKDMHHEAVVEHARGEALIAQIQSMSSKRRLLRCEDESAVGNDQAPRQGRGAAGRHVRRGRKSDMDLQALGEQLAARKQELQETAQAA